MEVAETPHWKVPMNLFAVGISIAFLVAGIWEMGMPYRLTWMALYYFAAAVINFAAMMANVQGGGQ